MDIAGEKRLHVPLARHYYEHGKLNEIIDLNLKADSKSVKEFSDIAYRCLNDVQEARPSMDLVLWKLLKALELHVSSIQIYIYMLNVLIMIDSFLFTSLKICLVIYTGT